MEQSSVPPKGERRRSKKVWEERVEEKKESNLR